MVENGDGKPNCKLNQRGLDLMNRGGTYLIVIYNFLCISLVILSVVGSATPVGVKRVGTKEAHHLLTASVLSTGTPSDPSLQVLSRLDLREQFAHDPAAALAALHAILADRGVDNHAMPLLLLLLRAGLTKNL